MIKKRADGRYCRRVYLGTVDGKKKYKSFYGATDKEAKAKEDAYRFASGQGVRRHDATFSDIADAWVREKELSGIGEGYLRNVRQYRKHLSPLDRFAAKDIRKADVQSVLHELADWHDGKPPLAQRTLGRIKAAAVDIFAGAIPDVVVYNPAANVTVPRGAGHEERKALDDNQQRFVRETQHRAQLAAMVMMYSGLRRGELTALTWADVDFIQSVIYVNKSYDFVTERIKNPKSKAGVRIVNCPRLLIAFLQQNKSDSIYVLPSATGGIMSHSAWRRLWDSYMLALSKSQGDGLHVQIEQFTPHQLRHTYATMLYLAGVDVMTARDQLGHSDIKTTLGIYTHLDKKHKRVGLDKLDAYLAQNA